jgi:hypothetical protein
MIEALWAVRFVSNLGVFGSGVVVFETERNFITWDILKLMPKD